MLQPADGARVICILSDGIVDGAHARRAAATAAAAASPVSMFALVRAPPPIPP
jgi:hypothetical protein